MLGDYDPLPTGDKLRQWLLTSDKLSPMEKSILSVLCDSRETMSKGDVLSRTPYTQSGSSAAAFRKLTTLGYAVKHGGGRLVAADELFG